MSRYRNLSGGDKMNEGLHYLGSGSGHIPRMDSELTEGQLISRGSGIRLEGTGKG